MKLLVGNDTFTLDGQPWKVPNEGFYATTAFSEYAERFIREESETHPHQPFFLYLAYNAPHSPIQARSDQIEKYRGKYRVGWDRIREQRFAKQQRLGLAGSAWHFPNRPQNIPAWDSLDEASQDFEDLRMATYAAMVDCVDQGVGRLMQTLRELNLNDNTLVIFMNDNGASPNDRVRRGDFGTPGTTWNLGLAWTHATNTPLKFYKRTRHGSGVTTPFIASWPDQIQPDDGYDDQPLHITDVLPTLMEFAAADDPAKFGGKQHPALPGRSFASVLTSRTTLPPKPLHFSLFNNMAVVDNGWRLVTAYTQPWQLYDLNKDRVETTDLSTTHSERRDEILAMQKAYEARKDVRLRLKAGEREPEYAPIYRVDGKIGPGAKESVDAPSLALAAAKARSKGKLLSDSDIDELEKGLPNGSDQVGKPRKRKRSSQK